MAKAKELYAKYHDRLVSDEKECLSAISDLILELSDEVKTIAARRNAKSNQAAVGILREINDKYNAIVSLFEAKDGASPIKRDGFMTFWKKEMPALNGKVEAKACRQLTPAQKRDLYSEGFAPSHGPMIDFSRPDALVTLAMLGMAPGRWN